MNGPIIKVENLGKKYLLDHQRERRQYTALRDVISEGVKRLWRIPFGNGSTPKSNGPSGSEEFWALKGVSFEIKQGEVVGIIGRNGAGKSTLLKILSRITEPSTGRVRLRGRVASLLEVGTGFHPELTGRENIYLNGAILGMSRAEIRRKFDEIVAFAEVEKFLDTPVKRYSSGMYVRLAFGVAAHLEPEILVVDEVLAVGDAEFQKKCLGKMGDMSRGGRTVLFVSHNMSAVQSLCGVGMLLEKGELRRIGPVEEVVGEYTAGLNGSVGFDPEAPVRLGPTLTLGGLDFYPQAIRSGGPMAIRIQLIPEQETVIKEMALLIDSEYGVRVSVLDLRPEGFFGLRLCDDRFDFEVQIDSLPLVEGDYRLGFHILTNDHFGQYFDVASFNVGAARQSGDSVPYHAQFRGLVDLDFSVQRQLVGAAQGFSQ